MIEIATVDLAKIAHLPDEQAVGADWLYLVANPDTGEGWLITQDRLSGLLIRPGDLFGTVAPTLKANAGKDGQKYFHTRTADNLVDVYQFEDGDWGDPRLVGLVLSTVSSLPTLAAPTFTNFQDTQDGGSVKLVPTPGVPLADFLWKFGTNGPYAPVPLDGIISVPNAAGAVYAYAPATSTHRQVPTGVSNAFSAYVPPTTGTTTPAAPTFTNFQDTQAGGSVTLVPATGVPFGDYLWKLGANGTYAVVPSDGILNVGNVDGQVFAYSIASGTRNQSLTGASATFTSYSATPTNTTPAAPTFTNFQDTQAGGSVTIVPDAGVSMALVVYALPGSSTFVAAPADGVVTVGNVAGVVQAKSLAGGTYNASAVRQSQAFTVYSAPLPTPPAPSFTNYNTTARTATIAPPTGYTLADLLYTLNAGTPTAVPGTGVIPVGNDAVTPGSLSVYVSASSTRTKGNVAVNEVGYAAVTATPNFTTTYNDQDNISTATWGAADGWQLLLNLPLSADPAPNFTSMFVYDPNGTLIGQLSYNGSDSDKVQFAIVNTNTSGTYVNNGATKKGTAYYLGTMVDGNGTRTGTLKLTSGNVTLSA